MSAGDVLRKIRELPRPDTPAIRSLRRIISRELASTDRNTVLALAFDLVASGDTSGRWVAYELVKNHPPSMGAITAAEIERLGNGISAWGAVDCFACYIAGPAWRGGLLSDARVRRWAQSQDRWWRRAALVSTVPLNVRAQGGSGDAERTLATCRLLLDDRDPMVVKALSWALRALAVRTPRVVSDFVERHEDRLASLVKREVRNKLASGLKNPRRSARARRTAEHS